MDDPRTMPAGPKLDAMVAERVMGWRKDQDDGQLWWHNGKAMCSHYGWNPSQSIDDAWRVLERMHVMGHRGFGVMLSGRSDMPAWIAGAWVNMDDWSDGCPYALEQGYGDGEGDTVMLAICRAALAIVMRPGESGGMG